VTTAGKIGLGVLAVAAIAGGIVGEKRWSERNLVTVQTSLVAREDLNAIVTASGEIKPKNYINLGANAMGPLTEIYIKEGDRVKKNQVVARIENTQADADVAAQKATIASAEADSAAAEAGIKAQDDAITTQQATLDRYKNELQRSKDYLDRYEQMYKEKLVAKQDYDQKRADYESALASVSENEARLAGAKSQRTQSVAQLTSAQRRVTQAQAALTRLSNVLERFDVIAPLDGVVTDLPVRVGETVVQGVQNSAGSTIMTIADMSLITAEVDVDETDVVSVQLGQSAEVSIEAMPNQTFSGKVIQIGDTAIVRSSGLAASQSATSTQEAKDFKVVVTLDSPPENLRPGLSTTAKIKTAEKKNVLAIPIQALAVRTRKDLEEASKNAKKNSSSNVTLAAPPPPAPGEPKKDEVQGVFVVNGKKAIFRPVETGISGVTDIEITKGLRPGDEIVTGSYKALRTLKPEADVKVDNTAPKKPEDQQS
jgi:HlyD family secretion protein